MHMKFLYCWFQGALGKLLLFNRLNKDAQLKIVENMWERSVTAGEILIQEGEVGMAASELYVVRDGKFEVKHTNLCGSLRCGHMHAQQFRQAILVNVVPSLACRRKAMVLECCCSRT